MMCVDTGRVAKRYRLKKRAALESRNGHTPTSLASLFGSRGRELSCACSSRRAMVGLSYGHDGPSPHEATINYTLSDCGTHYTITPRCYFDTKGHRAKVKLEKETGRLSIKPSRPVLEKDLDLSTVSKMVGGGYLFLPKKCDLSRSPPSGTRDPKASCSSSTCPSCPSTARRRSRSSTAEWPRAARATPAVERAHRSQSEAGE